LLTVTQSAGDDLFSAFLKQLFDGSAGGPSNLALALSRQPPKLGSVDLPGVSAFCWHLSSEPAFLDMHLFLLARHLPCTCTAHALPLSRQTPAKAATNVAVRLWTIGTPLYLLVPFCGLDRISSSVTGSTGPAIDGRTKVDVETRGEAAGDAQRRPPGEPRPLGGGQRTRAGSKCPGAVPDGMVSFTG